VISLRRALHERPGTSEAGETDAAAEPREEIQLEIILQLGFYALLAEKLKQLLRIGSLTDRVESVTHLVGVRRPLRRADRLLSIHDDVNLVVHAVADTLHVPEGAGPLGEILQADNGSLLLPHSAFVLILQDLSAILFARGIVVHLDRLRKAKVSEELRLHDGEVSHCAVALKFEHREDLLVPPGNRGLLVTVRGTYTEDALPLRVLQKLVFQPHLSRLGERPHTTVVLELGNRVGVLTGSENREA